jgi:hypothetical protein
MPDYLTRVAIAGARTERGAIRPVRATAAIPPLSAGMHGAVGVAPPPGEDEVPSVVIDPPKREAASRADDASDAPPVRSLPGGATLQAGQRPADRQAGSLRSELVPEGGAPAAEDEPPRETVLATDARRPTPDVEVQVARLVAQEVRSEIVRMPRALRRNEPPPHVVHETPAAETPAAEMSARGSTSVRTSIRETALEITPSSAPATGPRVREQSLARTRSASPETEKRSRVTIGRVELQVHQPPRSQPQAASRSARPSIAPANAIESRFLDHLTWKP